MKFTEKEKQELLNYFINNFLASADMEFYYWRDADGDLIYGTRQRGSCGQDEFDGLVIAGKIPLGDWWTWWDHLNEWGLSDDKIREYDENETWGDWPRYEEFANRVIWPEIEKAEESRLYVEEERQRHREWLDWYAVE